MKILLAGPGTGKTTKVKEIINEEYKDCIVQVISFTNATIDDLTYSFKNYKNVNCSTLHSFALKLNHLENVLILNEEEIKVIEKLSKKTKIEFTTLCTLFNCITFENMILSCIDFIKNNNVYALEKIGRLDLLIVDEFQDFNPNEQILIHLLSQFAEETIILGDDDQSIYSFKDADPEGIIELYNRPEILKLHHENICYRCPDEIVDACLKLINNNKKRIKKEWKKSEKKGSLDIFQTNNQIDTNIKVLELINIIRENDKEGSILILSPVGFAVKSLIPYLSENGHSPNDCLSKKIDLDDLKIIWILRAIYTKHQIINLICYAYQQNLFSKQSFIRKLLSFIEKDTTGNSIKSFIIENLDLNPLLNEYLNTPPELEVLKANFPEFSRIIDFISPLKIEESLNIILQLINPNNDFKKGQINIMSIHKSKGLQAEYVFILGLVSGILPSKLYGLDSIEAQRRLLFVGMTRALKKLYIISNIYWKSEYVHKVDKEQFNFAYWIKTTPKKYAGKISAFVNEIQN